MARPPGPTLTRLDGLETPDRRKEQWGRLPYGVHIQVYEHYAALNTGPGRLPVDIGNPDELAPVMARALQSLAG